MILLTASVWNLNLRPLCFQHLKWGSRNRISAHFGFNCVNLSRNRLRMARRLRLGAVNGLGGSDEEKKFEQDEEVVVVNGGEDTVAVKIVEDSVDRVGKLREMIISSPPVVFMSQMRRYTGSNIVAKFCIATAILFIAVRVYVARMAKYSRPSGSVADLVRRGQLRSDRRAQAL